MEKFAALLIPVFLTFFMLRLILLPIRLMLRLGIHAIGGFFCLFLLNGIAGFTGIFFPLNLITCLIAGILGVPGIGILALLEILPF